MDIVTPEKRSEMMSRIRGQNTKPELLVRSLLHQSGYRFRLHRSDLPGKPDIVLPKYNLVIFVNGCFWHRHPDCSKAYTPKSRVEYWKARFEENVERDRRNIIQLQNLGWIVITIWECETGDINELRSLLRSRSSSLLF